MNHIDFAQAVKRLFRRQKDAAGVFGVGSITVNRWCRGKQRIPPLVIKVIQSMLESVDVDVGGRPPSRVEQRRASQSTRFSLSCIRIYGGLSAAKQALQALDDEFAAWVAGKQPVPRAVLRMIDRGVHAGDGPPRSYAGDAPPNLKYGVSTPDCDYASVASAAKAYGITESTAYGRARRGNMNWRLVNMSADDLERSAAVKMTRSQSKSFRVYTPLGTFETVQAAADAHGIGYNVAYARARYGHMDWSRRR